MTWRRPWYEFVAAAIAIYLARDLFAFVVKEAVFVLTGRRYL